MKTVNISENRPATRLWVFLFFLSIYITTAGGHYYSSDGLTVYLVAKSLVTTGSVFLQNTDTYAQLAIISGIGGNAVPVVLPAQSMLMIPFYLAGHILSSFFPVQFSDYLLQLVTSFLNSFVTALLIMFFYSFVRKLDYSKRVAIFSSLIFGLTTIIWPYSKYDFSEPVVSLFLFGAFYWLFAFAKDKLLYQIVLAGTFIGIAQLTKVAAILAIGPLLLYYLWVLYADWKERRDIRLIIVNLVIFGGVLTFFYSGIFVYNFIRFGSLSSTGYGVLEFTNPIFTGIYGLTISTGKGFFLYSPTAVLLFFGIRGLYRKYAAMTLTIIVMALITVIFFSRLYVWHGDVALGPRYLVYLTPFLMLPVAEVVSNLSKKGNIFKSFFVAIVITGFVVQLITISVFYNTYLNRLIKDYPDKIGGYNAATRNLDLDAVWYEPEFAPIKGELLSLPKRLSNWRGIVEDRDGIMFPGDVSKMFTWFEIEVPDFWWVYFSISKVPKIYLLSLMLPFTVFLFSGYRLLLEVRDD